MEASSNRPSTGPSHRDYVIDRARRINNLFSNLERTDDERNQFFENPERIAAQFGITFSDEELAGIRAMRDVSRDVSLNNLKERLVFSPVAMFDANCSCAVLESGMFSNPGLQ